MPDGRQNRARRARRGARPLVNLAAGTITLRGPPDRPWAGWFNRRLELRRSLHLSRG